MSKNRPRIARESKTLGVMITLYCHSHHESDELCSECRKLLDYAQKRLDKCMFQEDKTTCANCPVHCFMPAMREKIREVMRYAGPRMTYRHPILALFHLVDSSRKEPAGSHRKADNT